MFARSCKHPITFVKADYSLRISSLAYVAKTEGLRKKQEPKKSTSMKSPWFAEANCHKIINAYSDSLRRVQSDVTKLN